MIRSLIIEISDPDPDSGCVQVATKKIGTFEIVGILETIKDQFSRTMNLDEKPSKKKRKE